MRRGLRVFLIVWVGVLSFSSCTIKKRVYMPGYHIEWKNKAQTNGQPANVKEKETETTTQPTTIAIQVTNEEKSVDNRVASNTEKTSTVLPVEEVKSETDASELPLSEYTETIKKSGTGKVSTKDLSTQHSYKVKKRPARTFDDGGGKQGLMMILVGILLILLGYVFFIAFLNAFGVLFWYIFGLAGSILVLIGLIVLILSLI